MSIMICYSSVAKPELADTKAQGCYCQPKKCQPRQKTRNSKPNRKRSLDSNQNSVRAHQKQRGSLGNITVHIFVRRLFYMYWRAAHQKQKTKAKTKEESHGQQLNYITTTPPSPLRLINAPAFYRDQSRWLHHDGRRDGEDIWFWGGFGASTTQYNK